MERYQQSYNISEINLMGINASGKGTQYGLLDNHFSEDPEVTYRTKGLGEYCRGVKNTPELFPEFRPHIEPHLSAMAEGKLLPDQNIVTVARLALTEEIGKIQNSGSEQHLAIGWDGFPRSMTQLERYLDWEDELSSYGVRTERYFMYLKLDDDEVMARTWNRIKDEMIEGGILSGHISHLSDRIVKQMILDAFPAAVATKGVNVREDDHPDKVPTRIEEFKVNTLPMIEKVAKTRDVKVIDASQSKMRIHREILRSLNI